MFPEPDSLRPLTSGMRTHRHRTMHLRPPDAEPTNCTTPRRVTTIRAVGAGLVLAACAAPTDDARLTLMTTPPIQSTQSAHSLTESAAPSPLSARGDATSSSTPDVSISDAFAVLVRRRVECLTNPQRCDVADFTAPGSSEARRMGDTVARFRREGLRLSPRQGRLELTVNAVTLDPVSGDVVVDSCERDSHVLVDARFTALGEIIVNESVVTTRARWYLVDMAKPAAETRDVGDRQPRWRVGRVDIVARRHGGVPCSQL
jgi:hypothetical protein